MGHSAGGHLALLYAYKAAAGHSVNGNPMHPISLVISEAGPIQFASKTVYNENEVEYGYVFADDNVCAMAGITMPNTTDLPEVYNEKLAILAAVSPYCIAQDFDENTTIPYTILAYGKGFPTPSVNEGQNNVHEQKCGDTLVPFYPAYELDAFLNTIDNINNNSKCNLFELPYVQHGDFSISIKPNLGTPTFNILTYCNRLVNDNSCTTCQAIGADNETIIKKIQDYYNKITTKLHEI